MGVLLRFRAIVASSKYCNTWETRREMHMPDACKSSYATWVQC